MQSQKPIFKKPFEHINTYEESTWLGNDKPFYETEYTGVFNDKYPCVAGHTLFIPKKNSKTHIYIEDTMAGKLSFTHVALTVGLVLMATFVGSSFKQRFAEKEQKDEYHMVKEYLCKIEKRFYYVR